DRLYVFWVTFMEKPQQPPGDTTIPDPTKGVTLAAVRKDVEAQLHWSEYVGGEWTTRESGDFSAPSSVVAPGLAEFDPKSVFVHVTKEYEAGEERGIYIHLHQTYSSAAGMTAPDLGLGTTLGSVAVSPKCNVTVGGIAYQPQT